MKKVLALILIVIFCLTLSACGKKKEFSGDPGDIPVKVSSVELLQN